MASTTSTSDSSSSAAATSALASMEVAIGARQGIRALGEDGEGIPSAMLAPFFGLKLKEEHGCQRMGSDGNVTWEGDGKVDDESMEMR